MELSELLKNNTKSIQDLLHHELSEFALAHILATLPEGEDLLREMENMIYKRTAYTVQGIFDEVSPTMDWEQNHQTIQLFVHEQTQEALADLKEKIYWWKRKI